jgi:glycine/D-amino acid oxidase-like deaminating enzyme
MRNPVQRRDFVLGGAALCATALGGCASLGGPRTLAGTRLQLPPVKATVERITRITVCTRPFRAEGPRLDVERIGAQTIVHNYGHGGSGWSLSWGSGTIAVRNALATGVRDVAVIGCGALGLTTAIVAQRAGFTVTIYAKDRPPDVRSSLATGQFTPDSRICLEENATPAFKRTWEEMCRTSFQTYQNYLGLEDEPVEWVDIYHLSGGTPSSAPAPSTPPPKFAELQDELAPDLIRDVEMLGPGSNPFPAARVRRVSNMIFNITEYARLLMSDFLENGGRIETREFHTPADFAQLRERTLINCTGYGARALFGDQSVIPVRGQLAHLIPQPEVRYGLTYENVGYIPRRDGPVVQAYGPNEGFGFGDDTTVPDRAEAEDAVRTIGSVFGASET